MHYVGKGVYEKRQRMLLQLNSQQSTRTCHTNAWHIFSLELGGVGELTSQLLVSLQEGGENRYD